MTVGISGLTIEHGSASQGAGIWNEGGDLTITDSTLSGDTASSEGGAIYSTGGTVSIEETTVSGDAKRPSVQVSIATLVLLLSATARSRPTLPPVMRERCSTEVLQPLLIAPW